MVKINYNFEKQGEDYYIKRSDLLDALQIISKEVQILVYEENIIAEKELLLSDGTQEYLERKRYNDGYKQAIIDCLKIVDKELSWIKEVRP